MARPRKRSKPMLSPTRISNYLECAMKYRYIYHEKIGRFYPPPRPALALGATLHNVLRSFHEAGGVHTANELVSRIRENWISGGIAGSEEEESLRTAGTAMVVAYRDAYDERSVPGTETLFTEKQIKTDMGTFSLAGRIDRVDRHSDGSLEVIDYKSGRWEVTVDDVSADLAMNIYQYILRSMYPGTRVAATIYCLRSGIQASACMSAEEAETFGANIQDIGEEIIARDFENVAPIRLEACKECEFSPRCERFWRRQEQYDYSWD